MLLVRLSNGRLLAGRKRCPALLSFKVLVTERSSQES